MRAESPVGYLLDLKSRLPVPPATTVLAAPNPVAHVAGRQPSRSNHGRVTLRRRRVSVAFPKVTGEEAL
jgi:hypothetical protein